MEQKSQVEIINAEINKELTTETANALLSTTFKGLNINNMKKAIMEGMLRGYTFQDFLKKKIYAIPFGKDSYSLITAIDDAREKGMKGGIVGKGAPEYEMDGDKIIACTITVKRKVGDYVGDYTAKVYFNEYYKAGKNGYPSLWDSKPRTMLAKVAEMHALRMACPEELSQQYIEEEIELEDKTPSRLKEMEKVEKDSLKMGKFNKANEKENSAKEEGESEEQTEVRDVQYTDSDENAGDQG